MALNSVGLMHSGTEGPMAIKVQNESHSVTGLSTMWREGSSTSHFGQKSQMMAPQLLVPIEIHITHLGQTLDLPAGLGGWQQLP